MLKIKKIFLILILFKSLALSKPFTSLLILSTPKDSGNKMYWIKKSLNGIFIINKYIKNNTIVANDPAIKKNIALWFLLKIKK